MHAIIKYVLKEYVTYDRNKSGTASLAPSFTLMSRKENSV